jgi:hypothetical protein
MQYDTLTSSMLDGSIFLNTLDAFLIIIYVHPLQRTTFHNHKAKNRQNYCFVLAVFTFSVLESKRCDFSWN